ncbi:Master replication protein, partial [Frankliniella fusca]
VTTLSANEDDPKSEEQKFILVEDTHNSEAQKGLKTFRGNLKSEKDIEEWIRSHSEETFTGWIVERVMKEENCKRMVARKIYVCHFNKKNKKDDSKRSTRCQAKIDIKIKKLNKDTQKNDPFLKSHDPPLQAVIVMHTQHNHYQLSFDAMSFLRATKETTEIFRQYFEDGHGPAASSRLHELKLEMEDDGFVKIGNSAINPKMTTLEKQR